MGFSQNPGQRGGGRTLPTQTRARSRPTPIWILLALTVGALLVQGYHPATEDAEIYTPGILKSLHPALFPHNDQFFQSHAHLTLFPKLIARSVMTTHLPLSAALLAWQIATTFLFLWGCWRIARLCFGDGKETWCAVSFIASLLSLPVAGTALFIMDPYLTTRSFSAPGAVLAAACFLERKFVRSGAWIVVTAVIHPLMAVFAAAYLASLAVVKWFELPTSRAEADEKAGEPEPVIPIMVLTRPPAMFPPVTSEYREILETRPYFFLTRWEWYEWLGLLAPFAILAWFMKVGRQYALGPLRQLSAALLLFGGVFFGAALVIAMPGRFANFAELQPLRYLQLCYILMFLLGGGLIGKFLLKRHAWRWALLFVPLCAGMAYAQHETTPNSEHLELPGRTSANPWVQAFVWIRDNTPQDAYFALNPRHMALQGEDEHGFRAIAERSMLADGVKDSGAASMFPELALPWKEQVSAEAGWEKFMREDFLRLNRRYGVDWVVVENKFGDVGLSCPYHNQVVSVCRVP